jgi:hypothetical protein
MYDGDDRSDLMKMVIMALLPAAFVISLVSFSYNSQTQEFDNNIISLTLLPELFSKVKQSLVEVLASNTTEGGDILTYQNTSYNIRIQYPANWTKDEQDFDSNDTITNIVTFFSPLTSRFDIYSENLGISIEGLSNPNMTLEEYATSLINDYNKTLTDFNLIETDTTYITKSYAHIVDLAENPAYKLVYTDKEDNINYETMEIGTIIGDKVYYIEYIAEEKKYSNYLPTIQMMINSLEIKSDDKT